jgi:hypothetical protein
MQKFHIEKSKIFWEGRSPFPAGGNNLPAPTLRRLDPRAFGAHASLRILQDPNFTGKFTPIRKGKEQDGDKGDAIRMFPSGTWQVCKGHPLSQFSEADI